MSFYCHLLSQLLLAAYQQPNREVSVSHNGQIGAQTSPLDSPMRYREAPNGVPVHRRFFTGRVRRVSGFDRRAAAAYGDANML